MSDLDHQMWLHMPQTQKITELLKSAKAAAASTLLNDADLHRDGCWQEVFAEYQVVKRVLKMFEGTPEEAPAENKQEETEETASWNTLIDSLDVD